MLLQRSQGACSRRTEGQQEPGPGPGLGLDAPSQTVSCPRTSRNLWRRSSCPFWTRQPATGTFFFPTETWKVARTEASPGPPRREEDTLGQTVDAGRVSGGAGLTEDTVGGEGGQPGAQLVPQLLDQLVDDGVQVQGDAPPRRELLHRPASPHVEAVDGAWGGGDVAVGGDVSPDGPVSPGGLLPEKVSAMVTSVSVMAPVPTWRTSS